jgi:hypothetical protein
MSAMKDLLLELVEMYEEGAPASYIMDVLIDQYDFSYDQALELYEQVIEYSSYYGIMSGAE